MAPKQVFLKTISGSTAVLSSVETTAELFSAASRLENLPVADLRLTHASRDLPLQEQSLEEFGIADGANVFALARLRGGGKKRKKKTYTKPKKIKHKHKTVKLAVLNYYKISSDGKIERLRRECPADTCGAGVFMAQHHDRVYCGKCSLTYVHS
ncbi:Ubiquitin-40S ribosomal protein S27a [Gracilariopsis chorda]|uniref:Ubiquitin-40S ribosomal protein S27a n=1 Tax=Gracilariopsis chorda TaxID=448386 RepID=A0A2V3IKT3_9FLOR|nr:Ubiquitin-40S ribosomal protein S27a [Gracilariopsis chorda]|eukprot:PXF42649.1 Ubiquitin-40S ribosomal protein S27a [Gracilariopsis chorda]